MRAQGLKSTQCVLGPPGARILRLFWLSFGMISGGEMEYAAAYSVQDGEYAAAYSLGWAYALLEYAAAYSYGLSTQLRTRVDLSTQLRTQVYKRRPRAFGPGASFFFDLFYF